MCCGQKRAQLTRHQTVNAKALPTFQRSNGSVSLPLPGSGVRALPTETRSAGLAEASPSHAPQPSATQAVASDPTAVYVQFNGQASMQVRGLATGIVYVFTSAQPVQAVHERDAAALLQTRFFRRA